MGWNAEACMQAARLSALKALKANGGTMPAYPGMRRRIPSSGRLLDHAGAVNNSPSAAGEHASNCMLELFNYMPLPNTQA